MFRKEDCCYQTYRRILRDIKKSGKYYDYADVLEKMPEKWLILRHDIEFSVDRAYQLSLIETKEGIKSTWFVQITNNAYNALSEKNVALLQKMAENGHHIGLHYHRGKSVAGGALGELKRDLQMQADILAKMTGLTVDRFSFHRPLREHLEADLEVDGLINAYGHQFFCLTDNPSQPLPVKYVADSNHQWKYGEATEQFFAAHDKIQLLIHPLSWSENGAEHIENFQNIVREKHDELIDTIEGEWKIFDELRGKL